MPLFKHTIRHDRAYEILSALTLLGEKDIPTAMTWPHAHFRRIMRHHCETIDDGKELIRDQFTEWQLDDKTGEPKKDDKGRRVPKVVYARNDDGSPRFKLDDKTGEPTTEREIAHGKIQLTDLIAHDRALRDFLRETAELEVPHLSWPQYEGKVKALPPNLTEAIMDFFDSPPTEETKKPTPKKAKSAAE
jgi:hypothetical protein